MNYAQLLLEYVNSGFDDRLIENRLLDDGIYNVSSVEFMVLDDDNELGEKDIQLFAEKYPEFTVAHAYETYTAILLSEKPPVFTGTQYGSSFNYGTTAILTDCPSKLLILAEND